MSARTFDAIIIGTGQAGPPLAGRMNEAVMKVAIVERHLVGGTCVNTGCKPTKALVASAHATHMARRGGDYGFSVEGSVKVDMPSVAARARKVILDSRAGNETWLAGMDNVELVRGHARFVGPHAVDVDGMRLTAPRIFINVGGRAIVPDMPGIEDVSVLTNTDMVALDVLPRHLVVIGGSYIGLEFAQMYRRFGSQVTIVERMDRLIAREDVDVSEEVRAMLELGGITVRPGPDCIGVCGRGDAIAVSAGYDKAIPPAMGSPLLVAVGRRPDTDDLGLEAAGIATDARGYITVDDHPQTNVPGVHARGD